MNKKLCSVLCAATVLAACAACASSEGSAPAADSTGSTAGTDSTAAGETTAPAETTAAAETTAPAETTAAAETTASPVEIEEKIAAEAGQAFLYINDGQFYISYDGSGESSAAKPSMCYDAVVADIKGDGKYTVSVRNDTAGLRKDATGDPLGALTVKGVAFACVKVIDGTKLYPDMSIEITEIRIDGKAVEMTAKNYTSSDDGKEMRSNIYNQWVSGLPEDAHNADGPIPADSTDYAPQIIDVDAIGAWTTFEVDFTVTGTGIENTAAETTAAAADGETETTKATPQQVEVDSEVFDLDTN